MNAQGGILGFELAEINLDGCAPYKYYSADRFALLVNPTANSDWAEKELDRILEEVKEEEKVLI